MVLRFDSNAEPIPGYRLIDRLGSGGFGEVWKCEAPGGIFKAVKIIHGDLRSKDNDLVRYAEQELKALKRVKAVRHPYLLSLDRYDIVEGRLLIVMELADCNLWDRFRQCRMSGLQGIPREELLLYMTEAAEVLDLMNVEHQLLHLDIKPQNIFLQYNHVKVGDFGQVKDLEGVVASVTGGITPVYAAPETFDGIVTRFCDQYSLACVYQELLTGQRPFDGTSMQQLLMQHLASPPNLAPSPPSDRIALDRALAKNPDGRWPSCREFVKHLQQAESSVSLGSAKILTNSTRSGELTQAHSGIVANLMGSNARIEILPPEETPPVALSVVSHGASGSSVSSGRSSKGSGSGSGISSRPDITPPPIAELDPPAIAPPEESGAGSIRPLVVIAIGHTGLRVVQRFRKMITDRYGEDRTPAVRIIFIDTDPETLSSATTGRAHEGFAALRADEVIATKLNRATHYLKPRFNGRSLIEGWFDPQMLHRLPRSPITMGLRPLGRLALCDHYRTTVQKLTTELENCLTPAAIGETIAATGLELRTNRPRVCIVTGLGGGTGSGMFLDLAYIARHRLRRLGYTNPDVQGILFVPSEDPNEEHSMLIRANTYAALTELNHYSRTDTSFQAAFDDRTGVIRDSDPPFSNVIFMTGSSTSVPLTPINSMKSMQTRTIRRLGTNNDFAKTSGIMTKDFAHSQSGGPAPDPTETVAEYLRLEIFGMVGRTADNARNSQTRKQYGISGRMIGLTRISWPRYSILDRTAKVLSGVVLDHWVSTDFNRARTTVPSWVNSRFSEFGLTLEGLISSLCRTADVSTGGAVEILLTQITDSVIPKKWLSRIPEPGLLLHAIDQISRLVGSPTVGRSAGSADEAVKLALADVAVLAESNIVNAVQALLDDPHFRIAGTEEVVQQIMSEIDKYRLRALTDMEKAEVEARNHFELLMSVAHPTKTNRKLTSADITDALRIYPSAQYRNLVTRYAVQIYDRLKITFVGLQNQLSTCRQRLKSMQMEVVAELEVPVLGFSSRDLLPVGCSSAEEASQKFLAALGDEDLMQIDRLVQKGIERQFGGLYQALLNSTEGASGLSLSLRNETRKYLNSRLGTIDLAGMMDQKYGPSLSRVLAQCYSDAQPASLGSGPWTKEAITVLGTPAADAGEPIRRAADLGFPPEDRTIFTDTADEVVIFREYPNVPFSILPQFGPNWSTAYESAPESQQCSPHTRVDVTQWYGVDESTE